MATGYPPESPLSVDRITAFVDTILSLTEAIRTSDLPCFQKARNAFMEQLTEAQLDHVVGRLLQLNLTMQDRHKYMEWVREYLKYDEGVALEELSTGELMRKFADYWKLIDEADGRDQTWKRNVRLAVLIGLLAECGSHGILDSTQTYRLGGPPDQAGQANIIEMYAAVIMNRARNRHSAIVENRIGNRALSSVSQRSWHELIDGSAPQQTGNTSSEQTRDSNSEQTHSSGVVQTDNQASYKFQPAEADEDAPSD